jgi:hypothetical protein
MNRILLLLLPLMLVAGCTPRLSSPVRVFEARNITTFDFTPYFEADFLFLPGDYNGVHRNLGYVELRFSPRTSNEMLRRMDREATGAWTRDDARVQPLLRQMHEAVVELGGNAVTHFSVVIEREDISSAIYRVSGFAVERL